MAQKLGKLRVAGVTTLLVLMTASAGASTYVERLSERGPPTFFVGALFALTSPVSMATGVIRRRPVAIHACRFGHGLKMLGAGVVLLPAGLLAAPLNRDGIPEIWMDGVVESFQEDYCSRPLGSFYP